MCVFIITLFNFKHNMHFVSFVYEGGGIMTRNKDGTYNRIMHLFNDLAPQTDNPVCRMATCIALLHHRMKGFFWTGFYILDEENRLRVGPYQGLIACQELKKDTGVCWAAVNSEKTYIVPDVNAFPGHIACNENSKSEIVVPVFDVSGEIRAVLDIDSDSYDRFDATDKKWLE